MGKRDRTERKFYVYVYLNRNGRPFYVGKGSGNRWLQHMRMTPDGAKRSNALLQREIKAAGGELPVIKIRENLTDEEATEIEIAFIKALGRGATGILVNRTDGGEGCAGAERTPEHNAKIGLKSKGRKWTPEQTEKVKASMTPERRAKLSADVKAAWARLTPEELEARKAKTRASVKAAMTPEVCAKISKNRKGFIPPPNKGRTGQPWTAEQREKCTAAATERKARGWHSDETRAKISDAHTKRREAGISGTSGTFRWRQRVREQRAKYAASTAFDGE